MSDPLASTWTWISIFVAISWVLGTIWETLSARWAAKATKQRVEKAERRVEEAPEKSKAAWDLARVTLESYFDRNLRQVSAIFWLSVTVMLIGVGIIFWGISIALQHPDSRLPVIVTGTSGVITELIGATFLILYRSPMQQASDYTKTLERINSVGMAMQVLDTMPAGDDVNSAKNATKAEIVMVLITQSYELTRPNPCEVGKRPTASKDKPPSVRKKGTGDLLGKSEN